MKAFDKTDLPVSLVIQRSNISRDSRPSLLPATSSTTSNSSHGPTTAFHSNGILLLPLWTYHKPPLARFPLLWRHQVSSNLKGILTSSEQIGWQHCQDVQGSFRWVTLQITLHKTSPSLFLPDRRLVSDLLTFNLRHKGGD